MNKIIIIVLIMLVAQITEGFAKTLKEKNFKAKADPRIELLTIVLHYTKWPYHGKFQDLNYGYFERVKKHFDPYKNHQIIEWFNEERKNWNLDDPTILMLWLSNPPKMQIVQPLPLHPTCQMDVDTFKKTIQLLNDYCEESNFMQFWKDNQEFYNSIEKQITELHPYDEYIELLENFYGTQKSKYRIIPAPLLNNFCNGPQLKTETELIPHYITDLRRDLKGIPYLEKELSMILIFHEFGHSFVNPVCEKYRDEIFKYVEYFDFVKEDMSAIAYPDWFPTFHEHLVRVGESLLTEQAGFPDIAEKNYQENLSKGFAFMPFFREKMEFYLENRHKYPTFESFFPELLKIFAEIKPVEYYKPGSIGIGLNIENQKYFVSYVAPNSAAEKLELEIGDLIESINGFELGKNEKKAFGSWKNSKKGNIALFKIKRNEEEIITEIEVPFVKRYRFIRR